MLYFKRWGEREQKYMEKSEVDIYLSRLSFWKPIVGVSGKQITLKFLLLHSVSLLFCSWFPKLNHFSLVRDASMYRKVSLLDLL